MKIDSHFIVKHQFRTSSLFQYRMECAWFYMQKLISDPKRLHLYKFDNFWQYSNNVYHETIVKDVFMTMEEARTELEIYQHADLETKVLIPRKEEDFYVVHEYYDIETKENIFGCNLEEK